MTQISTWFRNSKIKINDEINECLTKRKKYHKVNSICFVCFTQKNHLVTDKFISHSVIIKAENKFLINVFCYVFLLLSFFFHRSKVNAYGILINETKSSCFNNKKLKLFYLFLYNNFQLMMFLALLFKIFCSFVFTPLLLIKNKKLKYKSKKLLQPIYQKAKFIAFNQIILGSKKNSSTSKNKNIKALLILPNK